MRIKEENPAIHKALRTLVALVSILVVLLFSITALRRLRYPFELEELEGYVFISALRVFQGQPLYPRPSMNFIPYMYPPLYFYAAAGLGKITGMTIVTLRAISIASTIGCFAMIYAIVFREVRRHLSAIVAAGLYAGCYTLVGCWYDLGRLDSFFILLMLVAMYATRNLHPVIAALLWLLCFLTKQSILPAAFVMLCFDWKSFRKTSAGLLTFALGSIAILVWANHLTQGWYSFFVFRVPAANADIKLRTVAMFLPQDILRPLGLAAGVTLAAFMLTRPSLRSPSTRFYLAACSLIPLFWWIRSHAGSTNNADMPVYALLAILFGLSFARLEIWTATLNHRHAQIAGLLLLFGVLAQNAAGIYNPGDYVPAREKRAALASIVTQIQRTPGDVYVAQHPYYGWLAGKPVHADLVSLHDAEHVNASVRTELQRQLQAALTGPEFSAVAIDGQNSLETMDSLAGPQFSWKGAYRVPVSMTPMQLATSPELLMMHVPAIPQASAQAK